VPVSIVEPGQCDLLMQRIGRIGHLIPTVPAEQSSDTADAECPMAVRFTFQAYRNQGSVDFSISKQLHCDANGLVFRKCHRLFATRVESRKIGLQAMEGFVPLVLERVS